MIEQYKNLDDLWCDWGIATDAIMQYIKDKEPIQENMIPWEFDEAYLVKNHQDGYSISILLNSYNPYTNKQLLLSVKAEVTKSDEIFVSTIKRAFNEK